MFDYPHLSSSANHIFDLTIGYANQSSLSAAANTQNSKKINMYNQMAQVLAGHDSTGSILRFDEDGNIVEGGQKLEECFFVNFSRLLTKDEIKKGSFNLILGVSASYTAPFGSRLTITDSGAQNDFRVNSPAGEYAVLSASAGGGYVGSSGSCGLIFYQAGVAVITASVFLTASQEGGKLDQVPVMTGDGKTINQMMTGTSISGACDAFRRRIYDLSFNNTTELNSTLYFCRVNNNEFNYSSNPTYVSGSEMVVKNNTLDAPVTYITTIGLYSNDNELLGVAKLSEPIKKTPDTEVTFRVRMDW